MSTQDHVMSGPPPWHPPAGTRKARHYGRCRTDRPITPPERRAAISPPPPGYTPLLYYTGPGGVAGTLYKRTSLP